MQGRFDEAWASALPAAGRLRQLSMPMQGDLTLGQISSLSGDHERAEHHLRQLCEMLERQRRRAVLSTSAPSLGRCLCALRRYDEAETLANLGRELGEEYDYATQTLWRQVRALVHAHRGEFGEAERLAREAVEIAERTDALNSQGDALCDLAEVLAAAGRTDEAADGLEQALDRYRLKKNLAMVAQIRPRLENLRSAERGARHDPRPVI